MVVESTIGYLLINQDKGLPSHYFMKTLNLQTTVLPEQLHVVSLVMMANGGNLNIVRCSDVSIIIGKTTDQLILCATTGTLTLYNPVFWC